MCGYPHLFYTWTCNKVIWINKVSVQLIKLICIFIDIAIFLFPVLIFQI